MDEKANGPQRELFHEIWDENNGAQSERSLKTKRSIKSYFDKGLILLLILISVFAVGFIVGYERAHESEDQDEIEKDAIIVVSERDTLSKKSQPKPKESVPEPVNEPMVVPAAAQPEKIVQTIELPDKKVVPQDGWTIQVVTYTAQERADQEVASLKKEGYFAFVIPSGKYYQVCIDTFSSKDKAQATLKKILSSGRYRDAYIRKVKR